ncbi:unnamed protein product [Rotaria sordida]|uniref:Uncharacterized protein n=1 Tax=Rotaria sordida TaxID=392033 RepID=A0A814UIZ0_9BILA|nr:unnamed protein product [Rotaria sordida]
MLLIKIVVGLCLVLLLAVCELNAAEKQEREARVKRGDPPKNSAAPSWVKNDGWLSKIKWRNGDNCTSWTTRLFDTKYGNGNYAKGPDNEYNKTQKDCVRGGLAIQRE